MSSRFCEEHCCRCNTDHRLTNEGECPCSDCGVLGKHDTDCDCLPRVSRILGEDVQKDLHAAKRSLKEADAIFQKADAKSLSYKRMLGRFPTELLVLMDHIYSEHWDGFMYKVHSYLIGSSIMEEYVRENEVSLKRRFTEFQNKYRYTILPSQGVGDPAQLFEAHSLEFKSYDRGLDDLPYKEYFQYFDFDQFCFNQFQKDDKMRFIAALKDVANEVFS